VIAKSTVASRLIYSNDDDKALDEVDDEEEYIEKKRAVGIIFLVGRRDLTH
jgi:hypothetical protein